MKNFERIKPNHRLNLVDYEESKRKVKSKNRNIRELRKIKRVEVDIV